MALLTIHFLVLESSLVIAQGKFSSSAFATNFARYVTWQKENIKINIHKNCSEKCYKNLDRNASFTRMESDIIIEGFKCSIEMFLHFKLCMD